MNKFLLRASRTGIFALVCVAAHAWEATQAR